MTGRAAVGMLDRRRFLRAVPGAVVVAGGLPGLGRM
ncbi:MAG: twin-arginine translocation signal domain-containing protein, partial [Gammaproteobacteria bacterium]|nr:twin-arginine translocation signal domain-containing protein [Gammaproteobacteria bacterium]